MCYFEWTNEYHELLKTVKVNNSEVQEQANQVLNEIYKVSRYERYRIVVSKLKEEGYKVPPFLIGILHYLWYDFDWNRFNRRYLSWENFMVEIIASKIKFLQKDGFCGFDRPEDWLYFLENCDATTDATTYRKYGINSPFLWSGTNHYTKGKFKSDGKFYPDEVARHIGAVPIMLNHIILKERKNEV